MWEFATLHSSLEPPGKLQQGWYLSTARLGQDPCQHLQIWFHVNHVNQGNQTWLKRSAELPTSTVKRNDSTISFESVIVLGSSVKLSFFPPRRQSKTAFQEMIPSNL